MLGSDFFPVIYGSGSGGGGSIPTIVADTTLNVPADYATVSAAIAFVQSCVVLNDAQVTITVNDTETITDQITLQGAEMPYLHIEGLGAGPTIDGAAFVPSIIGQTAWIYLEDTTFGEIYGTFRSVNNAANVFLINVSSDSRFGSLAHAFTLNAGFQIGLANLSGRHVNVGATIDASAYAINSDIGAVTNSVNSFYSAAISVNGGSRLSMSDDSLSGNAALSYLAIEATTGASVAIENCGVGGYLKSATGSRIAGKLASFAEPVAGVPAMLVTDGGDFVLDFGFNAPAPRFGSTADLIVAGGGRAFLVTAGAAAANTSTGRVAFTGAAALVQLSGAALAATFTGGYSQPVNVATANGLIIG